MGLPIIKLVEYKNIDEILSQWHSKTTSHKNINNESTEKNIKSRIKEILNQKGKLMSHKIRGI